MSISQSSWLNNSFKGLSVSILTVSTWSLNLSAEDLRSSNSGSGRKKFHTKGLVVAATVDLE